MSIESKDRIVFGMQLRRARELVQLEIGEVAEELNVNQDIVRKWEEEEARPSLKQLEDLADFYGREIDYFLRETPEPPKDIEFRGKPAASLKDLSREDRIVLARFDELCRTAIEFERLLNKKREVELPRFDKTVPPNEVAQSLRSRFGIGVKPLCDLRDHLEAYGVRVFELPTPSGSFSGFSFWHIDYGPCILVNANESKGRRNFTLAHELAHLLFDQGNSLCYVPKMISKTHGEIEYKANKTAIELLLPEDGVKEDFEKRKIGETPTANDLTKMAYYKWCVSIQALGYRLESLRLIANGHTDTLFETKPKFFRRRKGSRIPRWEKQLGNQFVSTSIETYSKGLVSISKIAQTWQISIEKALKRIKKLDKKR